MLLKKITGSNPQTHGKSYDDKLVLRDGETALGANIQVLANNILILFAVSRLVSLNQTRPRDTLHFYVVPDVTFRSMSVKGAFSLSKRPLQDETSESLKGT